MQHSSSGSRRVSRSARKAAVRRRIALVLSGESSRAGQRPRSPAESRLANQDLRPGSMPSIVRLRDPEVPAR